MYMEVYQFCYIHIMASNTWGLHNVYTKGSKERKLSLSSIKRVKLCRIQVKLGMFKCCLLFTTRFIIIGHYH